MRVLVLGGTGSIGGPVVRELIRRGHDVVALARSDASARKLAEFGAVPVAGDISTPDQWLGALPPLDGVVHVAATFAADDEATDLRLLQGLLPFLGAMRCRTRFIHTGGCWLFGASDGTVATEDTPYDPLTFLAWSVPHIRLVFDAPGIDAVVVHPAMVYEPCGGVFSRFYNDAVTRPAVRVVADERVRWPLVHSDDLATLYALALELSAPRESYFGVAIEGMPVGRIARAYARRFGTRQPDPIVMTDAEIAAELAEWAKGHARDQRLSGEKARRVLGWAPKHLDPEYEIASIP
jgi:nucleoside-diphosphate-sugar epimerase